MGKRIYNKLSICRNCGGEGRIWQPIEAMPQQPRGKWCTCPQCLGSGLVKVHIETNLSVTPHTPLRHED